MNHNQNEAMEDKKGNVPSINQYSFIPSSAPDTTFASVPGVGFGPYSQDLLSWTTTASPMPCYQARVDPANNYPEPRLFERRAQSTGAMNLPGPNPMAVSVSQYQLQPTSFNTPLWSSNTSSGQGGMEGEYFPSPVGAASLSYAGSTSESPMGPAGQDWAALSLTPMDTTYMGSSASGSHSVVDNYDGNMYADESFFETVHGMAVEEGAHHNAVYDVQNAGLEAGEAMMSQAQPRPREGSKPSLSGRKSSVGSKESSSASGKKGRKRKPSSSQESQPRVAQGPKLRTAARRQSAETGHLPKPGESLEDQRARTSHNKVEKEYRNRLNKEFELVIDVLPPDKATRGQSSRGKMSKADVIGNATAAIHSLANEVVQLREKKRQMEERKKGQRNV